MTPKIAIIGRPNVGKSTLFNRLVGRKVALVHDMPGMTRDRKDYLASLFDIKFSLIDTAGLADPDDSSLTQKMKQQTLLAVKEADLILFMIDATQGCTAYDHELANELRRISKPLIVVANKCESNREALGIAEGSTLALGEVVSISAEHGLGLSDLYQAIAQFEDLWSEQENIEESVVVSPDDKKPIQVAIIGRPNVGKSTLINQLIGEERLLTGDMPGLTRDSIHVEWTHNGQAYSLIDTAGLKKAVRLKGSAESLAQFDAKRSIRFAEVVIVVIEVEHLLERFDLSTASQIAKEGRAMVLAINKIDTVRHPEKILKQCQEILDRQLTQVRGVPCIGISALRGKNLDALWQAVQSAYKAWNTRLSTGQLNRWLESLTAHHPPPAVKGRRIRLKYMTQVKSRPPTFALFCSQATEMPESYLRYIANHMRTDFKLEGIPIRFQVRGSKNPYADKKDS